ncbi:NADH dehydrogenase [ubiquinone] 1 beta subcomplex subunit 2, mitochondrial isoform 1-T3 [Salvelinus alpinus]|uniref:NADH dehydrogenase [ubiquinone] 1 beta subcomplex subunit 2, mitochondrial n=3 Tax=Salmoninae TaxID=504568 RepID=B9EL27_SALSA|nr:NADH dehydrogenase [ubiquinone] 1 beta subcomplex subunit 2, mitochondrial [Salmo salar]XP_024003619.1 NADH dehydrogenase [ubiquinone] 1 beta subcomplex subunit 2, mitochondrial-like [Salvelinus alpinus]XP_029597992.1 NADH dehydrogenase [ubiquinone] 1 beta subcomplex subunit 2, mitochondrial-like [Salmo trutta]XP_038852643.1 NADH dehydrogenase [ubiquinone] 1 beta subcomplex subunit 2, mitochondrial-like [Salvelinus namaycush]ACM08224.1 NADH dehydrogenase 1 beta subcomplex subunit 2, mitochon|eukprot:XP_014008954.1 PREDICTED: NADH dehydrogenase [ubiquinone] 1 beta subcomplex subunit 2, mitochondrial-like [Salmo salar]
MSSLGRAMGVLRAGTQLLTRGPQKIVTRKAGGGPHIEAQYRQFPQLTKSQTFQAELLSSAMWFWILWHCWHDPDAVMGHFPWPDASAWTDEELGIPADNEE